MKYPNNPKAINNYLNHRRNFLKGGLFMSAGLLFSRQTNSFAAESAEQSLTGAKFLLPQARIAGK